MNKTKQNSVLCCVRVGEIKESNFFLVFRLIEIINNMEQTSEEELLLLIKNAVDLIKFVSCVIYVSSILLSSY